MRRLRFWLAVAAALVLGACGDDGPEPPEPVLEVSTPRDGAEHRTDVGRVRRIEVDGKPCLVLRNHNTYGDTYSITCDWSPR